jgi:hypothetical protein
MEERICSYCKEPLDPMAHGNQCMHSECAYKYKKERQKNRYQIGNGAKLRIQKNEAVLAQLHKQDPEKRGYPYRIAMEKGLKFDCPYTERNSPYINGSIYMFDQYGYNINRINNNTLIIVYHVSEI